MPPRLSPTSTTTILQKRNMLQNTPFPRWLILLGLLTAIGPLAIDMYLPAFSAIAMGLQTEPGLVERTLASYLLGLALAQLFYGPVADRFGRKPPLILGLVIFTLASFMCAQSDSIEHLSFWRIVQAFGGAAGMAIPRAVIRDRLNTRESARAMSLLMLIMGVMPILAPLIGAQVLLFSDWRGIFSVMVFTGGALLLATVLSLQESMPKEKALPLKPSHIANNYLSLLQHRSFMCFSLAGGIASAGMFAYIAGSPRVFIHLFEINPQHFGFYFGANAAALIFTSQVSAYLLKYYAPEKLLRVAQNVQIIFVLAGVLLTLSGALTLTTLMIVLLGFMACQGFINPNAAALALSAQGKRLGTASALMGTLQMLAGALAGLAVSSWHSNSALPLTTVLAVCVSLSWFFGRKALKIQVENLP